MVKSKNKKSVIALVVMAFLLVASICLAATGAWFTSAKTDAGKTLTFGKVAITVTSTDGLKVVKGDKAGDYLEATNVMPGDSLSYEGTIANEGDEAYLFVKYSVEGLAADAAVTFQVGGADGVKLEGQTDVYYVKLDKKGGANANSSVKFAVELTGGAYDNEYATKPITAVLKMQAIQYANFADAAAAYAQVATTLEA